MRICFFGTYTVSVGYPVNRVLMKGLRQAGVVVRECRQELWGRFLYDMSSKPLRLAFVLLAAPVRYAQLLWKYFNADDHDCVLVGYAGFIDVLFARLANLGSMRAWMLRTIDRMAFKAADLVLVDTYENKRYFAGLTGVDCDKFVRSFVGEDDEEFALRNIQHISNDEFNVLFFGTYVPLHGVDVIVDAAIRLRNDDTIKFTVIGNGQMYPEVRQKASENSLDNVLFIDEWIETSELVEQIARADICLGIFGTTQKAARVIPYKVFDAMAMKRPVITRDSPAICELLQDGESVILTQPGSADSLAKAILMLRSDPDVARRIGENGYRLYVENGSPKAIGQQLIKELRARNMDGGGAVHG